MSRKGYAQADWRAHRLQRKTEGWPDHVLKGWRCLHHDMQCFWRRGGISSDRIDDFGSY